MTKQFSASATVTCHIILVRDDLWRYWTRMTVTVTYYLISRSQLHQSKITNDMIGQRQFTVSESVYA
jgi:hypothetical protein